MSKFRYKRGIPVDYDRQGYIYFTSRRYKRLAPAKRKKIDELCRLTGGDYAPALKQFVTTDTGAEEICRKYFLSQSTLERMVKRYYIAFSEIM